MNIKWNDIQIGYSGVSSDDVGLFLGKTLTPEETTLIDNLISYIEGFIVERTGRQFKVLNTGDYYYEEFKPNKDFVYFFKNYPVIEIYKIEFDNSVVWEKDGTSNILEENQDFNWDSYSIEFYTFASLTPNKIKIYYNIQKFWSDYVKQVIIETVADIFSSRDYAGKDIRNLSVGGLNVGFGERYKSLKGLINFYRKKI